MRQRKVGDFRVGAVGFGCATISVRDEPDDEEGLRAMCAALEAGVTLFDTADVYNPPGKGVGHSERLVRRALDATGIAGLGEVVVATKGGKYWPPGADIEVDGRPERIRAACLDSLARLGADAIPLYFVHTRDPKVPYAESVGALAELLDEGLIRHAGVSNVDLEMLELARTIVPVTAVENRYSPARRDSDPVIDRCSDLGIAFLPWGSMKELHAGSGGDEVTERFRRLAFHRQVSPEQVVIAWLLRRSPVVIPIPGSKRPATILDSIAGAELVLSEEELAFLESGAWVFGEGGPR